MGSVNAAREVFAPTQQDLQNGQMPLDSEDKLSIVSGLNEAISIANFYLDKKSLGSSETFLLVRFIAIVGMAKSMVEDLQLGDIQAALSLTASLNLFAAVTAKRFQNELEKALRVKFPNPAA